MFYIQITGDGNGELPLFDYPLSFGPYNTPEAAKHVADAFRGYKYDCKVAPIGDVVDANVLLTKIAEVLGSVEPMGRAQ